MSLKSARRPVRARAVVAVLSALATLAGVAVAAAPTVQATTTETGRVTFVADGDTIDVDVAGDGTSKPVRVRIAGIQAMELSVYSQTLSKIRGECWGPEATVRLSQLVKGKTVRLTSRYRSSNSRGRELRHVAFRSNGTWQDVGQVLIGEGLVIPDVHKVEYTKNKQYMATAQWAAAHRRGMYGDSDHCGYGPAQRQSFRLSVKWKGGGSVNGEYIKIQNFSSSTLSLGGWWVRDNALRRYTFPSSAKVKPGGSIYVHPGKGRNTSTRFYWGLSSAIFEDVTSSPSYLGDGGYLFDPQGDLRRWQMYPCRWHCSR
jgi:endonuclease YncB( thermonuclease family)